MAMSVFNAGLDAFAEWETATFEWALLTAGTFDADAATVADALGTEVTAAGYTRQTLTTPDRTVNVADDRTDYTAADPDFGTLDPGETVTAALLWRTVTDDSDSIPVAWWDITPIATDAIDPFTLAITGGLVAYLDQVA